MRVAAYQDAPVFLDRRATCARIHAAIEAAAAAGVELLAFGETYLPGYPFWLSRGGGAEFESALVQDAYARYVDAAICVDGPELAAIARLARDKGVALALGVAERGVGVASGSVYCSAIVVDPTHGPRVAHRKLVPTYEERLIWAPGDGAGLRAWNVGSLRVGVLNCWETWMPLARHALWAEGVTLLVSLWPGSARLTEDITRFAAREGRVFALGAAGVLAASDVPRDLAVGQRALLACNDPGYDGGSCVAGPDGRFIVPPDTATRGLVIAELDPNLILRARQSFDPTGHYARPDVFSVSVDRRRRVAASFVDE